MCQRASVLNRLRTTQPRPGRPSPGDWPMRPRIQIRRELARKAIRVEAGAAELMTEKRRSRAFRAAELLTESSGPPARRKTATWLLWPTRTGRAGPRALIAGPGDRPRVTAPQQARATYQVQAAIKRPVHSATRSAREHGLAPGCQLTDQLLPSATRVVALNRAVAVAEKGVRRCDATMDCDSLDLGH